MEDTEVDKKRQQKGKRVTAPGFPNRKIISLDGKNANK
jgi:hypothetical protein